MFRKLKHILLVLITAVSLILLTMLVLTERTTAIKDQIDTKIVPKPTLQPYIEPSVLQLLKNNVSEIPIILTMRSTITPEKHADPPVMGDQILFRQMLVHNLLDNFGNTELLIAPLLAEAKRNGDLIDRLDLWIINGMALKVRPKLLRMLIASEVVEGIFLDHFNAYIHPYHNLIISITVSEEQSVEPVWGLDRIRAPEVWNTFGYSGNGAVVAIMDTGVDFLHPALNSNYRGNLGKGIYSHHTSWFDVINEGVYPYDDQGHGSHVAGTAVGTANVGVAPGAQWIGVKVLNTDGFGYDSWILNGFQWLLAPAGDPIYAPDIVNASWSSINSTNTVFEPVIRILSDAGIFVVFAAGNEGPAGGSVGSPASNQDVFAVGASDDDDAVAFFSGRGPSFWREIKPYVVAPGVNIMSTLPGGVFAVNTGTSMATPHVAGTAAILRGISQTLPIDSLRHIITSTANPISSTIPNNESGWGRIDAFDAVVRLINPSIIQGYAKDIFGQGIFSSSVMAISHPDASLFTRVSTDEGGHYTIALNPGIYNLQATAFGYYPDKKWGIEVMTGTSTGVDFILAPQPVGSIHGRVYVTGTQQLVTETLTLALAGTPLSTTSSLTGSYNLIAPQGIYTLAVKDVGYRVEEVSLTVQAGQILTHDIYLTASPKLLLVDEGAWYYGSQSSFWTKSLDALRYAYDVQTVKYPNRDTPNADKLKKYDIVLWSSPLGAPGLVGGAEPLNEFLSAGGNLLLSGQDIAFYDAGGNWDTGPQPYLTTLLGVSFAGESDIGGIVHGKGLFDGFILSLEGGDGADNQVSSDVVHITKPEIASLPWVYENGEGAGCAVSICTPYRALFYGFGFEGIANVNQRRQIMDRSLDWLTQEPLTTGLSIKHLGHPIQIGHAGKRVTHTLSLRHVGILGNPENINLISQESNWPYVILPYQQEISPCTSLTVTVAVTIPHDTGINITDLLTLTAISSQEQSSATIVLETKTPAPVLLVDDDRWYPVDDSYISALEDAGISFDLWDNQDDLGGVPGSRSPYSETLSLYSLVVWFTGYDWYDPINDTEMSRLVAFLQHGGQLILSSQDFLYYHESDILAQLLGVQAVSDGQDINAVRGTMHPSTGVWKSVSLGYPFPLHTDVVEPSPDAVAVVRGSRGEPVAVSSQYAESSQPSSIFYGFPLEALPDSLHSSVLSAGVGWLSPLGRSDWQVEPKTASAGDKLTYTLIVHNDDEQSVAASMEHIIPISQSLYIPSLPSDLTYHAPSRLVEWDGQLIPGQTVTYVWQTSVNADLIEPVYPTVTFFLKDWDLSFDRSTSFLGTSADFSDSTWFMPIQSDLYTGDTVTLSFLLQNNSDFSGTVHASAWLMEGVSPVTATLPMTELAHGWYLPWWSGNIEPETTKTLTVPVRIWIRNGPVRVDTLLRDENGSYWEFPIWLNVLSRRFYLPLITK